MPDQTMRTRHYCPLCVWHLDTPDPDPFPALTPEWLAATQARHPQHADDPVFIALLAHNEPIEAEIRAHLETHPLEEWAREVMRLRQRASELEERLRPPSIAVEFPPGYTAQDIARFQAAYEPRAGGKVEYRQGGEPIGPDDLVPVYCPVCGSPTTIMHRAVVPVGVPRCGECVRAARRAGDTDA